MPRLANRPPLCLTTIAALCLCLTTSSRLLAGSHLWRINEVFSNRDGTIQFIELHECCGADGELFLRGLEMTSEQTGSVFIFPEHLSEKTGNRYLLLATAAYAALEGATTPDYILPDGFVATNGDKLWYSEARNYDSFAFGPGDLPLDGTHSIQLEDFATDEFTTAVNSPQNFAGDSGTVDASDAPFRRGDCDDDGFHNLTDAVFLLGSLFRDARPLPCRDGCDANDDGMLNLTDAVSILTALFRSREPLPEPVDCGDDPTADDFGCTSFGAC